MTMRDAPPFLLFDLGGVLIENVGFERLDALLPAPIGSAALKSRWLASPVVRAFESGKIDPPVFARGMVDDWQLACSPDAFLEAFNGWPKGFYPDAPELLRELRRTHRIGCLTNSNALHWSRFGGFDGLFDITLSSHRIGLIKPDAECFAHAVGACGVVAKDIVYFDDAMPNVDGARRAGMDAVHVSGFGDVLGELGRRGLIA